MPTKFALLQILNKSELVEIAREYGMVNANELYKGTLAQYLSDSLSKNDVKECVSYFKPDYKDYNFGSQRANTFVYALKDGHEIVYYGITYSPHERVDSHWRSGKYFTNWSVLAGPMYREYAEEREWGLIRHYQDTHRGRPPRYNFAKTY